MASPEAAMHWRKDLSWLRLFSSTSWLQHSWRDCLAWRGGFTCLSACSPVLLLHLLFRGRGEEIIGGKKAQERCAVTDQARHWARNTPSHLASQHPWGTKPVWEWEWDISAWLGPAADAKVLRKSNEPGMSPASKRLIDSWGLIWNLPWTTSI